MKEYKTLRLNGKTKRNNRYVGADKIGEFVTNVVKSTGSEQIQHGHPSFYKFTDAIKKLHSEKNYSYAHGGSALGNFDRVSSIMKLYPKMDWSAPEMVAMVYAMKQLDAYLWLKSNGHVDKFEGVAGRLQDIAVYTLIQMCIEEDKKND